MSTEEDKKEEAAEAADATGEAAGTSPRTDATADEPKAAAPVTTAEADHAHHDEDEPQVAEPDRINVGMIAGITMAIVIATIVVVIGVREFFSQTLQGEVNTKVLEPEDPLKKELYVQEQAKLTKYQWVNQKDGVVRIPIARAKELVLADYGKLAAYEPGKSPAPAPEPVPAPSASAMASASAATSVSAAPSTSAPPAPSASASHAPPTGSASAPHHH